MAELEARADADILAAQGRSTDELRSEIARHSGVAIERIVNETLDDASHQALIEGFIQRVGASTGASS
jgi:F0F1-type ATP synthase membrane subunit b/b'